MQATTLTRALITAAAALATAATVAVLGPAAGAAVARTGPAVLAFGPAPYHYGPVPVGQRQAKTFTLANTGGLPRKASLAALTGGRLHVAVRGPVEVRRRG